MNDLKEWVAWFRHASPYINAQRNQVMVLALSGEALAHSNLENIIHDIALLNSLGIRLVIVFGARPQINDILKQNSVTSDFHRSNHQRLRVTSEEMMPYVLAAYGRLRSTLEAKLSMGVINSPMQGAKINVVSGNFVMAKPYGVSEGIDLKLTGQVRKIDVASINTHLQNQSVILVPATGYSMTGDIFNLSYEALAAEMAVRLNAEKLIFFGNETGLTDEAGDFLHQITVKKALDLVNTLDGQADSDEQPCLDTSQINQLLAASHACQSGVRRVHLLSYAHDGALLEELFTRDGHGTMVSVDEFDQIRPARLEDTNGILSLIRPLEEQGFLVRRSRELLETELDYFLVEVRDNAIIACVGLYPFPKDNAAELSCFAVDTDYRKMGRGDRLLEAVTQKAKSLKLNKLFVLTTKTEQWFKERGFEPVSPATLPGDKNYNTSRNAKVLMKQLT
ncbi:MAG: amino-acid N-acetyltransferase [Oleiphilus sp.]